MTDIETSVVEKIPLGGGDWQPATFTVRVFISYNGAQLTLKLDRHE